MPQVRAVVHVVPEGMTVVAGERQGHETVTVADSNFFRVFRIPFVRGDPAHAFTAERRTKEIGVRKISGARTADIMKLMLWRISIPVLAANVVAWPVAYYYLRQWLEHYAYRISLNPTYFLGAGAVALFIAWATVYANTLRLARTNPVHSLRYE